ncbi:MAG TPA: calcium-binding protein, partial [Accumulibacter sp.]|uniref:calcium-binding protein n=1 Tax=Accumulibacter sp. TaxID=2053492 RepID=UPI002CC74AF4
NDSLDGGAGSDVLAGGLGDDEYTVDDAGDTVVEAKNAGTDKVFSSVTHTLAVNVENLELTGTGSIKGTGNTLANHLVGNGGANTLNGGAGADWMQGGLGNDTYVVDQSSDYVQEDDSSGTDTVQSYISYGLGWALENLTLLGTADIEGTGNDGANKLTGNAGDNKLDGGAGADSMAAGAGDDTYVVDHAGDTVSELLDAGMDSVRSEVSFTLGVNIENLTLLGDANLKGTGNALANILIGNSGVNTLTGGDGNDSIDGGAGADALVGGLGDDTYYVDAAGDKATEAVGAGVDTVYSEVSWILGDNLEDLVLGGWYVNLDGKGNALANRLTGNDWSNVLDGQSGADTLIGLGGDDTYLVDHAGDLVVEVQNGGSDTVKSSIDYTLGNDVEHLSLLGTLNLKGTGNALANRVTGNSGANTLTGGGGNDSLDGGAGSDVLAGGLGEDTLTGGVGADSFRFDTLFDPITNRDTISDYVVLDDTIQLENTIFSSLTVPGMLVAGWFRSGAGVSSAADADDYLIYDSESGALYYDADGNGAGAAVQFATLSSGLALSNADFLIT